MTAPVVCVQAARLRIAGVIINGYNAAEASPAGETADKIISKRGNVNILAVVPFDETVDIEELNIGEFIVNSLMNCDWQKLARM